MFAVVAESPVAALPVLEDQHLNWYVTIFELDRSPGFRELWG
jgi:hypothetical protein